MKLLEKFMHFYANLRWSKYKWIKRTAQFWQCFFPARGYKYTYLGYAFYYPGKIDETLLKMFFKKVDKVARPWWCPKFVLRLLHLYGNDNSIVRVKYWWAHNLFNKITKGVMITDMKWKYDSYRIYGRFPEEIDDLADIVCLMMEKIYED